MTENNHDPLTDATRNAARRAEQNARDPEPSLGRRLGQIGVLGWTTILPILLGLFIGAALDRWLGSGITIAAALTMLGAARGLWLAFKWMGEQ